MPRHDPYRNFRFRVEIDGIQTAGFSEISGLAIETDVIDYREGTDPTHTRKLPGLTRFSDVTLSRGLTQSMELTQWYQRITDGTIDRKNIAIVLQNEAGQDVARWQIVECFPRKIEWSALDAKGSDVAMETLVLAVEGIQRVA